MIGHVTCEMWRYLYPPPLFQPPPPRRPLPNHTTHPPTPPTCPPTRLRLRLRTRPALLLLLLNHLLPLPLGQIRPSRQHRGGGQDGGRRWG
jgi:hypothetical protein